MTKAGKIKRQFTNGRRNDEVQAGRLFGVTASRQRAVKTAATAFINKKGQ